MMTLGIDLGGTEIKLGIIKDGEVIVRDSCKTPTKEGYQAVLDCMANCANSLLSNYPEINFVGIGSPGLVDADSGVVLYSNNFDWHHVPLKDDMRRLLGLDVRIANDASCAALGETLYGAGQKCSRVAMITLGTGVGGGFIRNGKLDNDCYESMAHIFGHMVIEQNGEQCNCGRLGCMESYASAGAIARASRKEGLNFHDAKTVFSAAKSGDAKAIYIVDTFLQYLATGIVNIANILRPHKIIIGGGISGSSDMILPYINKAFVDGIYGYSYAPVEAVCAKLGNNAGLIGAGCL